MSRLAVLGLHRTLPERVLRALTLLILVVQPAILAVIVNGLSYKAVYSLWGVPIDVVVLVIGLLASMALIAGMLRLMLLHRWTVRPAATLLTLRLASLVLAFGLSLAYRGTGFAELGLSLIGVLPPAFLFAGLMAYDVLNFGARFANTEGRDMPRPGRALMYLGSAILMVASMLFFLNVHEVPFGRPDEFVRQFVNLYLAEGVLFLGPPYLAWTAWKRRERLVGGRHYDVPDRSAASEDHASSRHANGVQHDAFVSGALCGFLGYIAVVFGQTNTLIPLSVDIPNIGANWGAAVLATVIVGIAVASGAIIRYLKGTLSADEIRMLVGAVAGFIFSWIFLGFA